MPAISSWTVVLLSRQLMLNSARRIRPVSSLPLMQNVLRVWCAITATTIDNDCSGGADWKDGVVPVGMERVISDLEGVELGFRDLATLGILAGVDSTGEGETA